MLAKSRKRKSSPFRGDNSATNDSDDESTTVHETFSDDEEGGIRVCGIYIPPAAKPHCSMDTSGPRLIITHITNINFKSYAGKQVLGPFNKCFTAIIGPNGSGKSNVIDSMLFVFGYRASKIRSKKISVLIHNSERHQNVQSCTVTVHFSRIIDKDGEDYETVPDSEFTVSRTACKDNSSYYEINKRRVQFKEVAKLLRNHGIDLDHNRFLILQGEVEQIAMMKPKGQNENETGMMEYLEDIIGTVRYKEPIVKLNEQIEILTEERQGRLNRVKMTEKAKDDLEQPMQTAIEFLKIENAKTKTRNLQLQKYIYDYELLINEKNTEKDKIHDQLKKVNEELDNIIAQKKEKEAFIDENNKKFEKLTKKNNSLKESFENANKRDATLQAEAEQVNKKRKKTKELIREEQTKLQELEKVPEKNSKEIETFEAKEAEYVEQRETIEEEKNSLLASMGAETAPLQEKKEKLETKLVTLKAVINDTKSAYDIAVSELDLYRKNEKDARDKLTRLQESYASITETLTERRQAVKSLEKDIPKVERELNNLSQQLETNRTEEQKAIMDLRMKKARLEESRSAQQAAHSRNRVLNALVQAQREGSLPGLLGRLGDLGAIDLKYDVAVSTACGALNNIVVETVETAEKCIDILKRGNVGRATFIALDKQEYLRQQAMMPISTPENVPRLFDLIRVTDERVKTAFYFALRDTLVANDLEQATRIAYGNTRYRVVTLRGDVIEIVGTMSGGGKSVCKGRMGQRVAVDTGRKSTGGPDLKQLGNEIRQLETTVQETRAVQNEIGPKVTDLKVQLREMKMNLNKYNVEMESLVKQHPVIQQQIKQQEEIASTTLSDPAQVKKLQAVVDKTKTAYEEARSNARGLEDQVNELTEQINGKTKGRVKAIDAKLKECIKNIDKFRTEITRLKVAIKTAERNAKKSTVKIAQMEQEFTEAEQRVLKIVEDRKEIEVDCREMLSEIKEIQEQLSTLEDDNVKAEIAQLTKNENGLKSQKIDIEHQYNLVKESIEEAQAKIPDLRLKLSQLELHKIPREKTVEELKVFKEEDFQKVDLQELHFELTAQDDKLRNCKPNLAVIKEYNRLEEVYLERISELEKVTNKRQELRGHYDKLRKRRHDEFLIGFQIITAKLKEMYQMITLGGDAELELVDSLDPFSEGVTFSVRPPKKSWKNISNLSGGEKTLSSLALVFALHYYKPSPLYVMDEIDAALDFKNVSIVGNYIKDRTKNAQFIIISLRSNMFELADHLVGIYKTFNCTKSVTLNPRLYPPPVMPSQIGSCTTTQRSTGMQPLSQIPNPQPKA